MSIIDPVTLKPQSLLSKVGRDLLKNYIRAFMTGGMEVDGSPPRTSTSSSPVSPTKSPDFKINPTERLSDDAVKKILNKTYNIFRSIPPSKYITDEDLNQLLKEAPLITEIISFMKINLKNIRFNNVLNAIIDLEDWEDINWLDISYDYACEKIKEYLGTRQVLSVLDESYTESTLIKIYEYFRIGGDYKVLEDIKKNSKEDAERECINFIDYTEKETIDLNDLSRPLNDEEYDEYYNSWFNSNETGKKRIKEKFNSLFGVTIPLPNIKNYFYDNYINKEKPILELFNELHGVIISSLTDKSDDVKNIIKYIIIDYLLFKILANKFNFGIDEDRTGLKKMEKKIFR